MLYEEPIIIKENIWNNSFSFDKRIKEKGCAELYVPKLIEWNLNDVIIWDNIAFEEIDFNWNLRSYKWLKNFVKLKNIKKDIYIFDNHNHAIYFWYKSIISWKVNKWAKLIHIDQHSDMAEWKEYLYWKINEENLYKYTNYDLNVWNYIIPAIKLWFINEVIQVRSNFKLKEIYENDFDNKNTILNIDLDFWHKDMLADNKKDLYVKKLIEKIDIITIASSPYFIEQNTAINILNKLLKKL